MCGFDEFVGFVDCFKGWVFGLDGIDFGDWEIFVSGVWSSYYNVLEWDLFELVLCSVVVEYLDSLMCFVLLVFLILLRVVMDFLRGVLGLMWCR